MLNDEPVVGQEVAKIRQFTLVSQSINQSISQFETGPLGQEDEEEGDGTVKEDGSDHLLRLNTIYFHTTLKHFSHVWEQ